MAVTLPMEWEDRRYPKVETAHRSAYNPAPTLDGPERRLGGGGGGDDAAPCLGGLDAGLVTRVTNLAQGGDAQGFRVRNPPLRAVTEAVPNTFAPIVDHSRQKEVFGRRLLPHLRLILLHSRVPTAVLMALASMGDVVHDPERVSQAAREWAATSLVHLLRSDNHEVRESSCRVLLSLSGYPVGRDALLQEPHAIPALQLLLFDEWPSVRVAAAHTLRRLARLAHGPHDLDEGALAPFLVHLLRWETSPDILAVHLITLQLLLFDERPSVRVAAAHTLRRLARLAHGPHDLDEGALAPFLVHLLRWETSPDILAVHLITLQLLLFDEWPSVRVAAAHTLRRLARLAHGPHDLDEGALAPFLVHLLRWETSPDILAVHLITLQLLLFDEWPSVRVAAAHTLRRLARLAHGPHDLDEGALAPFLVHLLRWETSPDILAVHLITLQLLLFDEWPSVRVAAAHTLRRLARLAHGPHDLDEGALAPFLVHLLRWETSPDILAVHLITLQLLLFDEWPSVRVAAAHTLRRLARLAHGPHDLDEGALAPFLVHLLRWETSPDILAVHLITLQYLLYKDHTKVICIQQGAFQPLTSFFMHSTSPEVVCHALNVMSLLSTCYERGLEQVNLPLVVGPRLRSLLAAPQQELRAAAARFVMSFTYSEQAKISATGLVWPLLRLALRRRCNRGAQVFALQALTQLAEAPAVREALLAVEEDIEEAEVSDDATEALRQRLLAVVRATP